MKVNCPDCRTTIYADDIALDSGWAKCRRCHEIFNLADIIPEYAKPTASLPEANPQRPFDAWTLLERDDERLIVVSPARGIRSETWGLLTFTIVWLSFITIWTLGMFGPLFHRRMPGPPFHWERVFAAVFTLPFWMAGLGMLGAVIWSVLGTRRLYLDGSILYCESRCLNFRRQQTMDRKDVQHAREGVFRAKHGPSLQSTVSVDIVYSEGSFRVPVASESEQKWLTSAINEFLQSVPYRASPQGEYHAPEWPQR